MQELDIFNKDCPTRFAVSVIGGKWGLLIILALSRKALRFSELVRAVGGISERMASQTLKYLERYGLVSRQVLRTTPPQVTYGLTQLGRSFVKPLAQVVDLVNANAEAMVFERE